MVSEIMTKNTQTTTNDKLVTVISAINKILVCKQVDAICNAFLLSPTETVRVCHVKSDNLSE